MSSSTEQYFSYYHETNLHTKKNIMAVKLIRFVLNFWLMSIDTKSVLYFQYYFLSSNRKKRIIESRINNSSICNRYDKIAIDLYTYSYVHRIVWIMA